MATHRFIHSSQNDKVLSLRDYQLLETLAADILREPKLAEVITRYVDDRELGQSTLKQELFFLRDLVSSETDYSARLRKVSDLPIGFSPSRAVVIETAKRMAQRIKD